MIGFLFLDKVCDIKAVRGWDFVINLNSLLLRGDILLLHFERRHMFFTFLEFTSMMQLSANSHGFHRQMLAKRFKILDRWQITQRNRDLHCLLNSDCITEVKPVSCLTMLTWEKWAFHNLRIPKYNISSYNHYDCFIFLSLRNNENEYQTVKILSNVFAIGSL